MRRTFTSALLVAFAAAASVEAQEVSDVVLALKLLDEVLACPVACDENCGISSSYYVAQRSGSARNVTILGTDTMLKGVHATRRSFDVGRIARASKAHTYFVKLECVNGDTCIETTSVVDCTPGYDCVQSVQKDGLAEREVSWTEGNTEILFCEEQAVDDAIVAFDVLISFASADRLPQPSFDCSSQLNLTEEAICASGVLAEKDVQLQKIYSEVRANSTADEQRALKEAQKIWLSSRNACPPEPIACMSKAYDQRINELLALSP